jgi:phage terminase small subunit
MLENPQHQVFADEYLKDGNGTQAVIRAGYSDKGAAVTANRLLRNPKIQAYIAKAREEASKNAGVSRELVLKELLLLARSDPGQLLDERGNCRTLNEMPEEIRRCIASVKFSGDGGTEVKLWPKTTSLELLGKAIAMWTEKHEVTGANGGEFTVKVVSYEGDE